MTGIFCKNEGDIVFYLQDEFGNNKTISVREILKSLKL
jgi:hypothetical protein